jgi:hypothetical protein
MIDARILAAEKQHKRRDLQPDNVQHERQLDDVGEALRRLHTGTVDKDHSLIRRRLSRVGFAAAPAALLILLGTKMITKVAGIYPVTRALRSPQQEGMYTTLLMSTGLTFGTISALFGLSHEIVSQAQYSALVGPVIGSAVVLTLVAGAAFFLPRHLLGSHRQRGPAVSPSAASEVPARRTP